MRVHTVEHKRPNSKSLYNKTHHLHGRLPERPLCWLLGHKPVVHTYESQYTGTTKWIECARCRRRPTDLNRRSKNLQNDGVQINWEGLLPAAKESPWTERDIDSHAQIVIRKPQPELSLRFHVGGRGSETPIDGHATILGSGIYLGLGFGEKLAELLGGPDRDLKLSIHGGSAYWCLWRDDAVSSSDTPRWRQGSCSVNPLDYLFGPRRYSYEDVATHVATVSFLEGDAREVQFKLQRATLGRKGLPRFAKRIWSVDWSANKGGIPVYVNRDWKGNEVYGSGFSLDDSTVPEGDDWVHESVHKLVEWVRAERVKNGWKPEVSA